MENVIIGKNKLRLKKIELKTVIRLLDYQI